MNPNNTISKQEFLDSLFSIWHPVPQTEIVPVDEAFGRILAENQYARYDLPVVRASMMDGIAVRSADFSDGMPDTSNWTPGIEYARADTGDDFDDEYDSVIKIENVTISDNGIQIHLPENEPFHVGMNVKPAGANMHRGELIASPGIKLTALGLNALIQGGITEVPVIKKPRVGYIPTGSELIEPGCIPARGQNINSNSIMIRHLVEEMGGIPVCYPIVPDDFELLGKALDKAISENDIVLMSGGSSKGEEDFTTRLFEQHGILLSHWVKAAPGRPMGVAIAHEKPLVNLSGPSIAAFHGMEWCVSKIIAKFMGTEPLKRPYTDAVLIKAIKVPGILEFLNMLTVFTDESGTVMAMPAERKESANAYYITSLGEKSHSVGDVIRISLLCSPEEIPKEHDVIPIICHFK